MFSNLSPGTLGISTPSIDALIDLAARHGFVGVDLELRHIPTVAAARDAAARLADRKLRWGLFWMPADFAVCSDEKYSEGLDRLQRLLPIVQAAGGTRTYNHIWPGSDSLAFEENFAFHVRRLTPVARMLSDYGVSYGLEFLGPEHMRTEKRHPFIYSLTGVRQLIDSLPGNVGVVLDMFHWYSGGGTLEEVLALGDGRRSSTSTPMTAEWASLAPSSTTFNAQCRWPRRHRCLRPDAGPAPAQLCRPIIAEPFRPEIDRLRALPPDAVAAEAASLLGRLLVLA